MRGAPKVRLWASVGRVLAIGLVAVVTSFVASVWLAGRVLRSVDAELDDVVANANPTIDNMAAARAELRRLGMRQHAYLASRLSGHRERDRSAIDDSRHALHQHVRLEAGSRQQFPGEAQLVRQLDAAIESLDEASERSIDDVDAGRFSQARRELIGEFAETLDYADDAVRQLLQFNSRYRNQRLLSIHRSQERALRLRFALGMSSVVLAIATTSAALLMLRRKDREVRERNELLTDRATEMEAFANRVAHDLRNPLSAIALRIAAAEGQEQPPHVRTLLARLRERVRHMVAISDGLLDFAQAGRAPVGGVAEVAEVASDVVVDVQPAAAAADVAIEVAPSVRGRVCCSPGVLSSLLSNLVANAVKFLGCVPHGNRKVTIRAQRRGRCLRVEVEDNGPGVAYELQSRLFQPFSRVDTSQPGIGLGLATVKRLATAHGGDAGMRSRPQEGSCFWFELPLCEEPSARPAPAPA